MKKILNVFLALILVFGIFAVGCSDEEGKKDTSTEKQEKIYKMNQVVKVGDVQYKITKKKASKTVGNKYLNQKAQGYYLIIDISIKNLGDESLTVSNDFFKLYNGKKEYEADTDGAIYLGDDSIIYQDINPDVTLKGKVIFDVPKKVANSKDNVLQVQTGIFGTETEKIQLK
jgi:hypothetical protein